MTSRFSRHLPSLPRYVRLMGSKNEVDPAIYFGTFNVTPQVFYNTPLSFALVNLKPLLPGHVLVSPLRIIPRFTDLTSQEVGDLLTTVQKVQKMLAVTYFADASKGVKGSPEDGSFNIAIQDGPDAGQSVPHVHCHIIPRLKGDETGDQIYDRLASEEGNVGGAFWDRENRPKSGGHFPKIEDADRKPRTAEEMAEEAKFFKQQMTSIGFGN